MQERDSVSVLPKIERREINEENVWLVEDECVEETRIEEERVTVVEGVKKEFSYLNGSALKNLGRVVLTR